MSMTLHELELILEEVAPRIIGRRVLGLRDGGSKTYLLILEASSNGYPKILRLLLCVRPGLDRVHLTPRRSPRRKKAPPTPFTLALEQRIEGMEVSGFSLMDSDRVVRIDFKGEDGRTLSLVAEMIGRHANLLLLDGGGFILELARTFQGKTRSLVKGALYPALPALPAPRRSKRKAETPAFSDREGTPWGEAPLSGAADAFYLDLEKKEEDLRLKSRILKFTARRVKKEKTLLLRLEQELKAADEADRYRKLGDLLQANFHLLEKGLERIEVSDLFDPETGLISIPLDSAKGPSENINTFYKRYKKGKNSIVHLNERIRVLRASVKRFEEIGAMLPSMESSEALEKTAAALGLEEGKRDRQPRSGRKGPVEGARVFCSSDGLVILVGKDALSSDKLTFHHARGNDMWLHGQETAGSHVVIRGEKNKPVPLSSLMDAALLAVHFSKRRGADKTEVAYTQRKYIRRIRGGPPGRVTLERFKTLLVPSDPKRLKRILDSSGAGPAAPPDGP